MFLLQAKNSKDKKEDDSNICGITCIFKVMVNKLFLVKQTKSG